jgi:hypothetical protein
MDNNEARVSYSFANTPLKDAHAPLEMASISHAGFVCGSDMAGWFVSLRGWGDEIHGSIEA